MRYAALIDLETTGLSHETDRAIEAAVTVYDLVAASPIYSFASLMRATENPAEAINRIPVDALKDAPEPAAVWQRVGNLLTRADVVVAHRKEFDMSFTPPAVRDTKPWVCSKFELQWPRGKEGDSLVSLALAHDLGVAQAHRATADVDMLARLFTRARELGADLVEMMRYGLLPRATYQALVSFDDKEKAKAAGFGWEPATKRWTKRLVAGVQHDFPFQIRQLDGEGRAA